MNEASDISTTDQASRAVPDYRENAETRELPGVFELARPGFIIAWIRAFIEGWFVSRPYPRLPLAIPFLVVAVVGSGFVWWLRNMPQDQVIRRYEAAILAAQTADDPVKKGLYLRAITALRPSEQRYRFQLAMHQLKHGDSSRAVSNLIELTQDPGYMPARMWLVEQAVSSEPKLPLEDETIELQLRIILSKEPANVRANQILADVYLKRGQLQAAEDRLRKVVKKVPALGLSLAKVQRSLKRNEEQVTRHLLQAEEFFAERLIRNPADVQSRINRADALILRKQFLEAERLLNEGLALQDTPELRTALARLYASIANNRLKESILNRDSAVQLFAKAISIAPQDKSILQQMLFANHNDGFPPQVLAASIQFLKDEGSADPKDRLLLAQALASSGDEQQAIEIIEPLSEEDEKLRPMLVRLLYSTGQKVAADALIQSTLDEQRPVRDEDADLTIESAVNRAEILNLAGRFSESIQLLESNSVLKANELAEANEPILCEKWNLFYAQASLALFDHRLVAGEFDSAETAMKLLDGALKSKHVFAPVLERLVRLSCTEHDFAGAADKRLTKILASGTANPLVYNLLGTQALQLGQPAKARRYLERAYSLRRDNPMVLNNLAIALVRDAATEGDAARALQLANDALQILPEHPDVLSTRGEVHVSLKQWEDARRDFELSLPLRPNSRNSRALLAKVYDALGEAELAAEHRRIAEQLDVENPRDSEQ